MKTFRPAITVLSVGLTLLLTSCSGVFVGRTVPTLGTGENYLADLTPLTLSIEPGAAHILQYDLRTAGENGVYFVIDQGDLRIRTPEFTTYASSSTGFYFGSGEEGILPVSTGTHALTPSGVGVVTSCEGPCVILDSAQAASLPDAFVRITNPFTTERDVRLWVFSQALDDSGEPDNDSFTGAEALPLGSTYGALETLSDVDTFEVQADGTVTVYAPVTNGGLAEDFLTIEAELLNSAGATIDKGFVGGENPVSIAPDGWHQFTNIVNGDFVRIRAVDPRAAAAQYSRFEVELTTTTP